MKKELGFHYGSRAMKLAKAKAHLTPIAWSGSSPTMAREREIGYELHVGPGPENKILVSDFGGPHWQSWRVMRIADGHQSGWVGDFPSLEAAVASLSESA